MSDRLETATSESRFVQDDTADAGGAILRLLDRALSREDLREATERVAQPPELAEKEVARLLLFRLGDELLACESLGVNQVVHAANVHRIPHRTNKIVRGLCSLGGELLLCADLQRLLDLNEPTATDAPLASQRRMIVLGAERNRWVVEVDAVIGVTSVAQNLIRRPPLTVEAAAARYTEGLVPVDGRLATLLDVARILSGFQGALR